MLLRVSASGDRVTTPRPPRVFERFPLVTAVSMAAAGVAALWVGGRLAGSPVRYSPADALSYVLPLLVACGCLAVAGVLSAARPSGRRTGDVVVLGWPVLLWAAVVAVLGWVGGGPAGETVPVSPGWFLLTVVCTAVFEEFLCRGAIQGVLVRGLGRPRRAVLLTAAVFALLHLVGLVGDSAQVLGTLTQVGYTFCLGVYLGVVRLLGGTLWMPVVLHVVFNALGDVSSLRNGVPTDAPDIPVVTALVLLALALPVLLAGLRLLRRVPDGGERSAQQVS